jgi:hypothetical protein
MFVNSLRQTEARIRMTRAVVGLRGRFESSQGGGGVALR